MAMISADKLVPTIYTYTNMINACVRCFETAKAREYFGEMKKRGIEPNEVTYTALIKGYCQDGDLRVCYACIHFSVHSRQLSF